MRWLIRVFASAIVRRIAYALVALVIAALATQRANAVVFADQGSAYSACMTSAAGHPGMYSGRPVTTRCTRSGDFAQFTCMGQSANGSQIIGCMGKDPYYTWPIANSCEKRPDWNGPYTYLTGGKPKNGSITCNAGCKQAWFDGGDGYFAGKYSSSPGTCNDYDDQKCKADFGSGYYWNQGMSACEPEESKCPDGQKGNSLGKCGPEPCPAGKIQQADGTCKNKENECPAGQIKSPDGKCLPGDGQCAAGEVRGKDGTCKKDRDGDGNPDDGEEGGEDSEGKKKDEFSGGDDCKSPPSCSGSPIMCGQARIQWRIDCNTRKNRSIAGGTCTTPPVCTGEKCDAVEYSGLLMQWRSACALEKLATGNGSGSSPDVAAIRDALTGTGGNPNYGAESPGIGAWQNGGNTPPGKPNTAGYGWSGSCPQPPSFDVMGQSFQFNVTPLCNWLSLGSYFVLGLAALFSLKIVASKDA